MAVLNIVKYGCDILARKTKPVDAGREDLPKIIEDMTHTCLAMAGVGLAAPQVGLDMALALIMLPVGEGEEKTYKRYVLINPVVDLKKGLQDSDEGCLSFPGLDICVPRAEEVIVKYTNEKGLPMQLKAKGYLAIVLQHEIDHLNGIVFIDHLKGASAKEAKAKLAELAQKW